jgi:hypothetical protein
MIANVACRFLSFNGIFLYVCVCDIWECCYLCLCRLLLLDRWVIVYDQHAPYSTVSTCMLFFLVF